MLDLNFYKNSKFFKKKEISSGEYIFKQGDIDNNLYIIESGEFIVEKYTTSEKNKTEILANILSGEFFGEGALKGKEPKEASIKAITKSSLLYIHIPDDLEGFIKEESRNGLQFLQYIIEIGNKRLLKSNSQIAAFYEMNRSISEIESIDCKNIVGLFHKLKLILDCDRVIFIRKSPISDEYYIVKFDSDTPTKMLNQVIEIQNDIHSINSDIKLEKYTYFKKLNIGNIELGYIILGNKNKDFNQNEKRIISSIATSLSGVIKQKELLEDELDRKYMKGE